MLNGIPLGTGAEVLVASSEGFSVGIVVVEAAVASMLLGGTVCIPER